MSETSGETPGQTPGEPPVNPYGQPTPPGGWPAPAPQQPYAQAPYQGYQQPGYGYGQPATPYAAAGYAPPEDKGATTAMVLGIVGLVAGFLTCIGFAASPFALFLGLASKRRIDASGGQLGGGSKAQAGFVMGIIGTVLLALVFLLVVAIVVLAVIGIATDSSSYSTGTNA